ncbi:serine racemase VanT catalytic subunit [Paenibacillaceae bacterium WGS1546]|uniref:serine racemase VanT catalytic subunit n=1 Tax=Cohnella sp. WGS1546 TaxID=3366810 RepID=UPI00372D4575
MARRTCGGIDRFMLIAALLVVAIHTGPLFDLDPYADFVLTGIIARIAVPTRKLRRKESPPSKHRVWAEIDLDMVAHNLRELRRVVPADTAIMAVVKANAYGHGAYRIAKRLEDEGVNSFAAADVDEAVALRRKNIRGEILILGYTTTNRLRDVVRYGLTQTAVDAEDAERLQAYGACMNVHVKIDTGLGRLGENFEDAERVLSMFRHSRLRITGTYSHLASADRWETEEERVRAFAQFQRFERIVDRIRGAGRDPGRLHIQSSYGLLNYDAKGMDAVRPGIALYGLLSQEGDNIRNAVDLRPALSLKATVALVKRVREGEPVGYGGTFSASRDSIIATLSAGYGDGIPRELSERGGCVLLRGRRAPIVGKICMDQMLVDVTDIDGVRQGDAATLIGEDGGQAVTAGEMARRVGTIANEIVASIGSRVERVYVEKRLPQ